jgi:hypothetical protein
LLGGRRWHAGVPGPVSLLETAHALEHIARPADGLAVFAVIDNVEADLNLLTDDIRNAIVQARGKARLIVL